jgi:hypothetical protein
MACCIVFLLRCVDADALCRVVWLLRVRGLSCSVVVRFVCVALRCVVLCCDWCDVLRCALLCCAVMCAMWYVASGELPCGLLCCVVLCSVRVRVRGMQCDVM